MRILVVGHGLAGANIAWQCFQRKFDFTIIDNHQIHSSSIVAAGLMNPITGRKFNKTWLAEAIFPFAKNAYRQMEQLYNATFLKETHILRALKDTASENNWMVSSKEDYYKDIMTWEHDPLKFGFEMNGIKSIGVTHNCMLLDIPSFLTASRVFYQSLRKMREENFEYQELLFERDGLKYRSEYYDKVIFCEGYQAINNPYFPQGAFELAKGEALIINSTALHMDYPLKHHVFFSPLGNDDFWIGSTYEWDTLDPQTSENKRVALQATLDKILNVPYQLKSHLAGIRPTTRDRRPIIGASSEHTAIQFFNGLGTKGSSLAPFFANRLMEYNENGKELMSEISPYRLFN